MQVGLWSGLCYPYATTFRIVFNLKSRINNMVVVDEAKKKMLLELYTKNGKLKFGIFEPRGSVEFVDREITEKDFEPLWPDDGPP